MPKKPFRITFIPTMNSGVVYYRMWNFAQALRKIPNVEVAVYCWQSKQNFCSEWMKDCYTGNMKHLIKKELNDLVSMADITVVQTCMTPMALSIIQAIKEITKKPVFMEVDDYVMNIPRYNAGSEIYWPNSDMESFALEQLKMSDGVITTQKHLAEMYEEYNDNIHCVPNSIDFKAWKHKNAEQDFIKIGWIGGGTHSEDLEMVWPALEEVLEKNKNVKFHCCHGTPDFLKDKKNVIWDNDWDYILEYPKLFASKGFDIGIAPLTECAFNVAKSNLRYIEYSAMKIPSVCSNLGHFTDSIKHGKNGFLADTTGEWIDSLNKLIKSETLRKKMGREAYKNIKANFEVHGTARKYLEILKKEAKKHELRTTRESNRAKVGRP